MSTENKEQVKFSIEVTGDAKKAYDAARAAGISDSDIVAVGALEAKKKSLVSRIKTKRTERKNRLDELKA